MAPRKPASSKVKRGRRRRSSRVAKKDKKLNDDEQLASKTNNDNDILADEELSFFNKTVRALSPRSISKRFRSISPLFSSGGRVNRAESALDNVEKQTEQFNTEDTFWYAVKFGQRDNLMNFIEGDKDCLPKEKRVEANETCLEERDPVGATPLHLLCLFGHTSLAMEIISKYPERGLDMYDLKQSKQNDDNTENNKKPTLSPYHGENCLHIAIVKHDMELVKCLVENCGEELFKQETIGSFFLPSANDAFDNNDNNDHDDKTVYFGGFPLSFAVASNQPEIVKYLINEGADITAKDSSTYAFGNTAMHISILYELPEMYDLLLELWQENNIPGEFSSQLNKYQQSALTYSAAIAKSGKMFRHILHKQKVVQWNYGPVTCVAYPLKELDVMQFKPGDRKGCLEYFVENEHFDLISDKLVLNLIDKKWKCFAEEEFNLRFWRTTAFICSIFLVSMLPRMEESIDNNNNNNGEVATLSFNSFFQIWSNGSISNYVKCRYIFEILAVLLAFYKSHEELKEMHFHGVLQHFTAQGAAVFENLASAFCIVTVFALFIFRVFFNIEAHEEDAILASLNIAAWINLLWFFVGMSPDIGIFVIILHKMIISDLKTFSLISFVFLGGFSTAFHLLGEEEGIGSLGAQVVDMMANILGDFDISSYSSKRYPHVATGLALLYIFLLSLVLVNMLIAKMGDTYSRIVEQAEKRWLLERARLVIDIERGLSDATKESIAMEHKRYWILEINNDHPTDRYLQVQNYEKLGEWSSLK